MIFSRRVRERGTLIAERFPEEMEAQDYGGPRPTVAESGA